MLMASTFGRVLPLSHVAGGVANATLCGKVLLIGGAASRGWATRTSTVRWSCTSWRSRCSTVKSFSWTARSGCHPITIATKFTQAFEVEHPIVQGGMQWVLVVDARRRRVPPEPTLRSSMPSSPASWVEHDESWGLEEAPIVNECLGLSALFVAAA